MSSVPLFQNSGAAEILRSAQKDALVKQKLEESLSSLLLKALGTRTWLRYQSLIGPVSSFLYYSSTTLFCLQTLGEEYTGIIQVDSTLRHLPSFYRRLAMTLFDSFGYYSIIKYVSKIENGPTMLAVVQGLHRALFYYQHSFYDFPKRLTNIKYILIRSWLKDRSNTWIFRVVGLIALLTSLLTSTKSILDAMNHSNSDSETDLPLASSTNTNSAEKCTLCLEEFKNISVTPCGHLFCWQCIHICVQSKRVCPVCRDDVQPNRIVMLQNYDACNS
uniref:RING-type E3 ubiquitin transferase n=1 Tax=Cacopsylla melanoneura TaxID=428564 RepID=A0A8D8YZ10_9HEMI